jgi:2-phosphoglycerate kinase
VLLIGGNSGAGKSVISRRLAKRFGVGLAEVDDFRLVLQRMTTPEQQPDLHRILALLDLTAPSLSPASVACEALIAVARTVSHALEIVIANHVATEAPAILEGDGIAPALAAQRVFAGREVGCAVRAVFLVEEDRAQLLRNALAKGRGFEELPFGYRERSIELSWRYGQWLREECMRHHVPLIAPRPWATLDERIVCAIQ